MGAEKVADELQGALRTLYAERDELDRNIKLLEDMLAKFGAKPKRGPGRPKGSKSKGRRGPGRPPGSGKKKKTKKKVTRNWSPAARKAAAERMKKIWAERNKKKKGKKTTSKKKATSKAKK